MKPGSRPKGRVSREWSIALAYAIGLLTADGCLSKDGRHIDFTSKDKVQVELFKQCLGLDTKVSDKYSGAGNLAYHTQFGDVLFYKFLLGIGLTPAKSKTLGAVAIPPEYLFDFLRGYFDGDGSSYSYYDPQYPNSFRYYLSFTCASLMFVEWLRASLEDAIHVKGHISRNRNNPYVQLRYSKKEAVRICEKMYYRADIPRLRRKYLKVRRSMRIIEKGRSGEIGIHATFRS